MPQTIKPQRTKTKSASSNTLENLVDIEIIHLPEKQQPRRSFSDDKLAQLVASIEEHGILEPLIVRPLKTGGYELVAGERRLRAAKAIGLSQVPIVAREFSDTKAYEVALLENLQRDDLNPIDETEGVLYLLCQVLQYSSKDEVVSLLNRAANAKRRGVNLSDEDNQRLEEIDQLFLKVGRLNRESFRTNRLPLLNMPEDVLEVLREGELEYTKAKAIAKLEKATQRKALMEEACTRNLSLAQIKQRIQDIQGSSKTNTKATSGKDLKAFLSSLSKLKSDAWEDETKQKDLKILLSELEELLRS